MKAQVKRAFTLVEILIVVVILGILAAVVVPQFVDAADQAQTGNTETQLRTLRTQIQLFRAQSDDNAFPALAGADGDAQWQEMIDEDLIQAPPINPRSNSSDIVAAADTETGQVGQDAAAGLDADAGGWLYNAATGEIWAVGFNEDYDQDNGEEWGF
ncbi:MAG: prepilin-type N-terminal cleavage/methylation domain-containing protein [Planctomycetota bacterium]